MTNNKEKIRQIISSAIGDGHLVKISERSLKDTIQGTLMCIDDRTVDKWFNFIWRLGYIDSPQPHVYQWNMAKIEELEIPLKQQQEDLKQVRLL